MRVLLISEGSTRKVKELIWARDMSAEPEYWRCLSVALAVLFCKHAAVTDGKWYCRAASVHAAGFGCCVDENSHSKILTRSGLSL